MEMIKRKTVGDEDETVKMGQYLLLRTILCSLIGWAVWFVVSLFGVLNSVEWIVIFVGFSGCFLGFYGGILHLYRI